MSDQHTLFTQRRQSLMSRMQARSMAIVPAAHKQLRNGDCHYPFRQNSDFYYLTGFNEPDALLVLYTGSTASENKSVLFCHAVDPDTTLWDGANIGPDNACNQYGMQQAFPLTEQDDIMAALLDQTHGIYYAWGHAFDQTMTRWLQSLHSSLRRRQHLPAELFNLNRLLHPMRQHKSQQEIDWMRQAAVISAQAHCRAMALCRPDLNEYHLEAEILHHFMQQGARYPAYASIVGSGHHACTLHYTANNARLHDGDLVLIDAGCEYQHYAADITRTFPVNGRFSAPQKALYDVVLNAQQEAIKQVKPGNHCQQVHDSSVRVITEGLVRLGLLKGQVDTLIKEKAYLPFYGHRCGHWLGMDVHDVGDYQVDGAWLALKEGMAMTVEPGIYVAADNTSVDPQWRGIGIRIEDDVVVTAEGCEILSDAVPKTIDAIEALVGSAVA